MSVEFVGATMLAAAFALGVVWPRGKSQGHERFLAIAAPGTFGVVAISLAAAVIHGASFYWNPPRLVASFALAGGDHRMYFGPDEGPVLNMLYPPMSAIVYLPATLARTTFGATLVEAIIGGAFFFGPASVFFWWRREPGRWLAPFYAFSFFVMVALGSFALRGSAFFQPIDPIALGFATGACAALFMYVREETPSLRLLTISAICAVLAVWSKQTMAPLGLGLPIYLAASRGWSPVLAYVKRLAIAGVIVSAPLLALFGPRELFFNMWTLPSHHPFRHDAYPFIYLDTMLREAREWSLLLPLLAMSLVLAFRLPAEGASRMQRFGSRLRTQPWLLLVWISFCLLPTSFLGFMKEGGRSNSISIHTYFLTLAASLCLLGASSFPSAASPRGEELRERLAAPLLRLGVVGAGLCLAIASVLKDVGPLRANLGYLAVWAAVLALALWAVRAEPFSKALDVAGCVTALLIVAQLGFETMPFSLRRFELSPAVRSGPVLGAYDFAQQHPGEVYFPYDPLATLLSDGKIYHFDYGLFDRRLAGFEPSLAHFNAHIPPRLKYVAYPRWERTEDAPRESLRFLSEFSALVRLRHFEQWDVYMRPCDVAELPPSRLRPFARPAPR